MPRIRLWVAVLALHLGSDLLGHVGRSPTAIPGVVPSGLSAETPFSSFSFSGASSSPLATASAEMSRLSRSQFHHLGNLLRSLGEVDELAYLVKKLQAYIVQRSLRNAKAGGIANGDEEEALFFGLFETYGDTDHHGANWTDEDKANIRKKATQLVKKMNRRRRLEGDEDFSL